MKHSSLAIRACTLVCCAFCIVINAARASDREQAYTGESHPQNAVPGEVWCLYNIPATTRTVSEQVMVQPASCTYEVIPAVMGTRSEQVCVKPESKRRIDIPAEYKTESY